MAAALGQEDTSGQEKTPYHLEKLSSGGLGWDGSPEDTHPHGVGVAASPSRGTRAGGPRGKRRDTGALAVACAWVVENQIGLALNLLVLLALTHLCFPRARRHTRKFFELSYHDPGTGRYNVGWNDMSLVSFWIVVFTGLRVGVMEFVLIPLAHRGGIRTKKGSVRFAEQAWILIYYCVFFSLGLHIYQRSGYWLNLRAMWTDWPDRTMDGLTKFYYLVQYAFWVQQIIVVNIEERRKDYHQMFTHHIITCALVFASYGYHQTKVGNVILVIMDVVDIVLPVRAQRRARARPPPLTACQLAKILKYLHYQVACNVAFGVFLLTWLVARHILFPAVIYSVWAHVPLEIASGCYAGRDHDMVGPFPPTGRYMHLLEPFRDPAGVVCWDDGIKWAFLIMLCALQLMALIWFGMIVRVALRVVQGGKAEDSRSDDEADEEDEDAYEADEARSVGDIGDALELPPLEEEVGVEAINLKGRASSTRRYKKAASSTSGATLPGHSDRKDLLGRIGCDKTA
ncbi:MAG: sphingosine N-acyltransferase lag1 [Thelocarpon impressellum]|nr:MAG: sphingosine N-acyltransferase lag1 [Thelocarpon impressellum]